MLNFDQFKERFQYDIPSDIIGTAHCVKLIKAWDKLSERYVCLKFFSHYCDEKGVLLEKLIHQTIPLKHPHVVRYFDIYRFSNPTQGRSDKNFQVCVMGFADKGTLADLLARHNNSPIGQRQARSLFEQLLIGLQFLHDHRTTHINIRPENLFLHASRSKLTPLNREDDLILKIDSPSFLNLPIEVRYDDPYLAPEYFSPQQFGIKASVRSNADLWSLGVIAHQLFSGKHPLGQFSTEWNESEVRRFVLEQPLQIQENIPEPYKTIIRRCLIKSANQRARSTQELYELLCFYENYQHLNHQEAVLSDTINNADTNKMIPEALVVPINHKQVAQEDEDTSPLVSADNIDKETNIDTTPSEEIEAIKGAFEQLYPSDDLSQAASADSQAPTTATSANEKLIASTVEQDADETPVLIPQKSNTRNWFKAAFILLLFTPLLYLIYQFTSPAKASETSELYAMLNQAKQACDRTEYNRANSFFEKANSIAKTDKHNNVIEHYFDRCNDKQVNTLISQTTDCAQLNAYKNQLSKRCLQDDRCAKHYNRKKTTLKCNEVAVTSVSNSGDTSNLELDQQLN